MIGLFDREERGAFRECESARTGASHQTRSGRHAQIPGAVYAGRKNERHSRRCGLLDCPLQCGCLVFRAVRLDLQIDGAHPARPKRRRRSRRGARNGFGRREAERRKSEEAATIDAHQASWRGIEIRSPSNSGPGLCAGMKQQLRFPLIVNAQTRSQQTS